MWKSQRRRWWEKAMEGQSKAMVWVRTVAARRGKDQLEEEERRWCLSTDMGDEMDTNEGNLKQMKRKNIETEENSAKK